MRPVRRTTSHPPKSELDQERADRFEKFVGIVARRDTELVDHWRAASAHDHAAAMGSLSNYAQAMVKQTGVRSPQTPMPAISRLEVSRIH